MQAVSHPATNTQSFQDHADLKQAISSAENTDQLLSAS